MKLTRILQESVKLSGIVLSLFCLMILTISHYYKPLDLENTQYSKLRNDTTQPLRFNFNPYTQSHNYLSTESLPITSLTTPPLRRENLNTKLCGWASTKIHRIQPVRASYREC